MKSLILSLIAGLALVFAVSTAEAGGGTKPNSTIKVTNNTGTTLAVIVDPSNALISSINGGTVTEASFKAAGGKIVENGNSASFSVKAGPHTVGGALVSETGIGTVVSTSVTTTKGKTKIVNATSSEGSLVLTPQ
jgi:hypothetical protein